MNGKRNDVLSKELYGSVRNDHFYTSEVQVDGSLTSISKIYALFVKSIFYLEQNKSLILSQ